MNLLRFRQSNAVSENIHYVGFWLKMHIQGNHQFKINYKDQIKMKKNCYSILLSKGVNCFVITGVFSYHGLAEQVLFLISFIYYYFIKKCRHCR